MPKKVQRLESKQPNLIIRKKRVAAYARVSVSTEELLRSLDAQISYYSRLIQSNPGWDYAGVFVDRGITGTQTESRDEFNRMLAECEAGNIDIILVKSLSRFARNTVDTLQTIRRLKALGIEVRFEKENINTLDESGELMITLYATFAQEESRSISDNVKWGIRKRIANGTIGVANKHILGYQYNEENRCYEIIPEEAEVVQEIYTRFLDGESLRSICKHLSAEGHLTIKGNRFQEASLAVILRNELYIGDMRRQKTYSVDPITKVKKKNKGQVQQYYYTGCHEAILDKDTWERTQVEYARRVALFPKPYCFTGKITCGVCGRPFTMRRTKADGHEYFSWFCRAKKDPGQTCLSDNISDSRLRNVCAEAMGLEVFDEETFHNRVKHITITMNGDIEVELLGGQKHLWKNWHTDDFYVPASVTQAFENKIRCSMCGNTYHRVNSGGKWIYWYCTGKKRKGCTCTNSNYKDYQLRQISSFMLNIEMFRDNVFLEQVDYIEAVPTHTLIYHFKDGRTATWQKA